MAVFYIAVEQNGKLAAFIFPAMLAFLPPVVQSLETGQTLLNRFISCERLYNLGRLAQNC